jgi:hypothetical protein
MKYLKQAVIWCRETVSKQQAKTLYITAGAILLAVIFSVIFIIAVRPDGYEPTPTEAVAGVPLPPPLLPLPPLPVMVEHYEEENYDYYEEEEPSEPVPLGLLTGLPIYEAYESRRPIAVVVNNMFAALPQSGISSADVIYEVLTEGNITRFVAVFQSEMPEIVGPVRSTRNYFAGMGMNHDAIFIHHGGTCAGYDRLRELNMDALNGMDLEGRVFWRDRTYPAWTGLTGQRAQEHSSYTGWERMSSHIEARGIRDYLNEGEHFGFNFGEIPEEIERIKAADFISVPFSAEYVRQFYFQPEYGVYLVKNRRGPHVDALTKGDPIFVSNILVQITAMRVVCARAGYRDVDIVGAGRGYLATEGELFAVRWEKASHTDPMRWYFECGTPLVLTPGKTWINILQNTATITAESD